MNLLLSKRQLINLAVVAAAVGANAFVAWTQIDGQREIDLRAGQAATIRHDLDRYRDALGSGLSALSRLAVQGEAESAGAREARAALLDETGRVLRAELAGDADLAARFDATAADAAAIAREIDETLARAGQRVADERGQAVAGTSAAPLDDPQVADQKR